ncbi:hypothetical protein [Sphingopyxis sp. YR583]|uniref:hypothetical protein n=1 Tax=Sphingopyxis sp. YR583 TaxID=1881047 RepID=UPI000B847601|nr:hypothetical protein [Sphingopyxis sp. YR583]
MIDILPNPLTLSARRPADARWPAVAAALAHLRAARRRAVRIVDAECGDGMLLIGAALHARAIGFTAIEARGIGIDPLCLRRANNAAAAVRDPAIGLLFEPCELAAGLAEEAAFPADILLWLGGAGQRPEVARAAERAAQIVIGWRAPRMAA